MDYKEEGIYQLKGKILKKINVYEDEIYFYTTCNKTYKMYHIEDCCENVSIDDILGIPIEDLIGDPILTAESRSNSEGLGRNNNYGYDDSFTWTFYELATIKGSVTIRWYGTSNGYYSESVSFIEIK